MSDEVTVPGYVGGMTLTCELPPGYLDENLQMVLYDADSVIVTHPEQPALIISRRDGAVACIMATHMRHDLRWFWRPGRIIS